MLSQSHAPIQRRRSSSRGFSETVGNVDFGEFDLTSGLYPNFGVLLEGYAHYGACFGEDEFGLLGKGKTGHLA